ncbi:MAG: helix-turn-helix transcriptional regulator [Clostridia bacterium]|jgi:transcriptional regulator with XRE-family HTH domain|nr:helix-turn-helix transcriptional regulator [Clostridia bacterium]
MVFLENLDFLLKAHNMKRADLARAIHVAPSTINSWYARGTDKIKLQVLIDISNYFNVSLEYLINGNKCSEKIIKDDYTDEEIKLINDFCNMLKERRLGNG